MAMAIDYNTYELELSGYSTATTTVTSDDHDHNWKKYWSPVVDWEALSRDHNDYQDLIDSMMDDGSLDHRAREMSNSGSVSTDTDTMLVDKDASVDNFKGLRLVHLLIAAAEALAGGNESRELARVLLVRLKELVSPKNGTNMERLAAYFTDALQDLLDGLGGGSGGHGKLLITNGFYHRYNHDQTDVLSAFQLLQDMSPYVKFGHFTANQAILEAVTDDKRIHIVDYDIMEGIQWAPLMQALVSRKDGPPVPHLRITALTRGSNGRQSICSVQVTGRRLTAFAASIGQPFSFHQCRLDSGETFKPSALKLGKGEGLVMNCMLHLPHFSYRSPTSVASFLSGAKILNPRLVTLVEEDVGPRIDSGFVGRFMNSLHYYSAVYDSLEAGFPIQRRSQALVERVFLGPQIAESLGRIHRSRGEEEIKSWWEWVGGIGLKPGNISFANHCQAKLLVDLFNDGYRVEELGSNRLVLGWKSRRLLSASIWTSLDSNL